MSLLVAFQFCLSLSPMFVMIIVGEPVKKEILKGKIVPRHTHVWLWTAKEKTTELPRIAASQNVSHAGHVANQTAVELIACVSILSVS